MIAGFLHDTCGPRPLVAGHGVGAVLGAARRRGRPSRPKLVLLPNPMHTRPAAGSSRRRAACSCALPSCPGATGCWRAPDGSILRPSRADRLTVTGAHGARDLVRHAHMDLGGDRVRSWAKAARRWPRGAQRDLLDAYPGMDFPVLLLWADDDPAHPLAIAEEALKLLPDAQLRVLPRTGFLIAYDDPVGVARELAAFCG